MAVLKITYSRLRHKILSHGCLKIVSSLSSNDSRKYDPIKKISLKLEGDVVPLNCCTMFSLRNLDYVYMKAQMANKKPIDAKYLLRQDGFEYI